MESNRDPDASGSTVGRPRGKWLLFGGAAILSLIVALFLFLPDYRNAGEPYTYNGVLFDPPETAPPISLIDQKERPVNLSDFQGDVVLVYFGFTHCPDECPATLGIWKQVHERLGRKADEVKFVMITVDPERDTPEAMGSYLANFSPDFIGLSGELWQLEDIALDYNVFFKRLRLKEEDVMSAHVGNGDEMDDMGDDTHDMGDDTHEHEDVYLVAHTTLTFVVDREGWLVMAYPIQSGAQEIVSDLEHLLQE